MVKYDRDVTVGKITGYKSQRDKGRDVPFVTKNGNGNDNNLNGSSDEIMTDVSGGNGGTGSPTTGPSSPRSKPSKPIYIPTPDKLALYGTIAALVIAGGCYVNSLRNKVADKTQYTSTHVSKDSGSSGPTYTRTETRTTKTSDNKGKPPKKSQSQTTSQGGGFLDAITFWDNDKKEEAPSYLVVSSSYADSGYTNLSFDPDSLGRVYSANWEGTNQDGESVKLVISADEWADVLSVCGVAEIGDTLFNYDNGLENIDLHPNKYRSVPYRTPLVADVARWVELGHSEINDGSGSVQFDVLYDRGGVPHRRTFEVDLKPGQLQKLKSYIYNKKLPFWIPEPDTKEVEASSKVVNRGWNLPGSNSKVKKKVREMIEPGPNGIIRLPYEMIRFGDLSETYFTGSYQIKRDTLSYDTPTNISKTPVTNKKSEKPKRSGKKRVAIQSPSLRDLEQRMINAQASIGAVGKSVEEVRYDLKELDIKVQGLENSPRSKKNDRFYWPQPDIHGRPGTGRP